MAQHAKSVDKQLHSLFVYGTLKRSFPNHYFLRHARFLGPARTVERYSLYVDEYPLVYQSDSVCPIWGEAYEVDAPTLSQLDWLQGQLRMCRRNEVGIRLESGELMQAWIYFSSERSGRLIPSGEFKLSTRLGREQA